MSENRQQVEMTAAELEEYAAFKAEREKKRKEQERKELRASYAKAVDDEVAHAVNMLTGLSGTMKSFKERIYADFDAILEMKSEITGVAKDDQRSHTFTTSDGTMRLILGVNTIDGYRDTVEDGIAMVKEYIESLATDEKSRSLVSAVLRLLSRDQSGNIKASRVIQLRKMAEESGDDRFIEGVRIIEESYQPTETKRYIRAERRDSNGAWVSIPLSLTDAG